MQGPYAVAEVVDALHRLDADPDVAVIIIARGGGSIEDLLPFSDETLIRAVADVHTPVVSAIGHGQDSPLLDLVADVRASTPTDAARRVVPEVAEQLALIGQLRGRARRCLAGRVDRELGRLASMRSPPALAAPAREVQRRQESISALAERGRRRAGSHAGPGRRWRGPHPGQVLALSPAATLGRGYAIVQQADGAVVRAAGQVAPGGRLTLRLAEDQLTAVAEAADQSVAGRGSTQDA